MATETLKVPRAGHQLHVEVTGNEGVPLVLLHGFPDNLHLYDELMPHLGDRRVVRFDFLGWGRSDKPVGYPYTADNQTGDLVTVIDHLGLERVVLVAHDASGPPAIDWALLHPHRVSALVLLNTYYHQMLGLRRPPVIALYSTPLLRVAARALAGQGSALARRLYRWQVGRFIRDDQRRATLVNRLYDDFTAAQPAFWRLNDDLLGTVLTRRRRLPDLRRFDRPVRVVFGAEDSSLNPRVARRFAELFPRADLHLLPGAGHFVQVDQPERIAELVLTAG
ncbi:alpha/beta hydrolase [Micromonospora sp. DR5-3]|uniref:alpha/beta fold hydrolase n=1 Tax=unclassified Micromonospora TaxID=2617518 RepID=UPI0011D5DE83|nr:MULTISPECIES: alpha/beta hydrolase [unclassified Micromonospora]MCW3819192.1 alpha/beta hydrolase [Micromonospora sp. DR5-3]TYC20724.1 alpha/beta hydrolase [Micromonospora sp. MP36]